MANGEHDRISVPEWDDDVLQAAHLRVGLCEGAIGLVGIDFIAQDGNPFAHGHVDIRTAEQLVEQLLDAIDQAKQRMAH